MKRFKSIKELDAYMQSRNYHHINSVYNENGEEYVREYRMQDNIGNRYVKNFVIYELNMDKYIDIWYNV